MTLISPEQWGKISDIIRLAHDSFFTDTIVWKRFEYGLDIHGEDNEQAEFEEIPLNFLLSPNDYRTWPLTKHTESGELDKQSIVALFNLRYLQEVALANNATWFDNSTKRLKFNSSTDRFFYRGIEYKAEGDTLVSLAGEDPLLLQIIMQREELSTGSNPYEVEP
jgi:hypothetical protein